MAVGGALLFHRASCLSACGDDDATVTVGSTGRSGVVGLDWAGPSAGLVCLPHVWFFLFFFVFFSASIFCRNRKERKEWDFEGLQNKLNFCGLSISNAQVHEVLFSKISNAHFII